MTYIARPQFEDSRLQDQIHWFEDNALLLAQFAHALGYTMDTDENARRFGAFLKQQWLHEIRYCDPDKPEFSVCLSRYGLEIIHECE